MLHEARTQVHDVTQHAILTAATRPYYPAEGAPGGDTHRRAQAKRGQAVDDLKGREHRAECVVAVAARGDTPHCNQSGPLIVHQELIHGPFELGHTDLHTLHHHVHCADVLVGGHVYELRLADAQIHK
jgi:hypothetical protein